jgi:hypothetical protein
MTAAGLVRAPGADHSPTRVEPSTPALAGPETFARTVRLSNSTVVDNDGFGQGIEIASERRRRLAASTCGKSQKVGNFGSGRLGRLHQRLERTDAGRR